MEIQQNGRISQNRYPNSKTALVLQKMGWFEWPDSLSLDTAQFFFIIYVLSLPRYALRRSNIFPT